MRARGGCSKAKWLHCGIKVDQGFYSCCCNVFLMAHNFKLLFGIVKTIAGNFLMVFKHFFKNYSFRKRSLKPIFHNSTETQNWRELVCNNANKRGNFLAFHRSISQKKRKHFCVFLKSYKNYILESLGGLEIAFFVFSFSETFTRVYQFFCISMRTREMFFYFICKLAIQTIEK